MLKADAQKKLSLVWFVNAGILALYFVVLTATGKFGSQLKEAFQWYAQFVVPTLMLIVGAFYATASAADAADVEPFYYRLCMWLSAFYFLALYLTLLLAPWAAHTQKLTLLQMLSNSAVYLALFQGVVSYALGLFFTKAVSKASPTA